MQTVFFLVLIWIFIYTFGFAVTLWKGKQKLGALAVMGLCFTLLILPLFSNVK
ncbi:hypothetical protein [Niallia sp. Krafla_26]|uniref:hypothetical protein n=1 Tax=Niallia sp. Krafla_26 TaxID=3064703 RepID=UPI003D17E302